MPTNKEQITKIIKKLGIPANLKGYQYTRYAIELLLTEVGLAGAAMMLLYQKTGQHFNTTYQSIERNIRHAINIGWTRADQTFIQELFGNTLNANKETPTNSEFLSTVTDYILTQQEN